jgi:RNA polymerase I-specific transcription initiation factor RRN3
MAMQGHFPHKRRSALRHEVFLRNSLTVTSYVPALRDPMLHLAIHRMLKIDVCTRPYTGRKVL